jgi:hypothetical protein
MPQATEKILPIYDLADRWNLPVTFLGLGTDAMLVGLATIDEIATTGQYFRTTSLQPQHKVCKIVALDQPGVLADLDLLLVVDPFLRNPDALRAAPCPVAGYLIDVHLHLPTRLAFARYFDYVFVAQPDYLQHFEELPHASAHWLPLACDPTVHYEPGQERICDVGFVGKLGDPNTERYDTLKHVLGRFTCNDYGRYYTPLEMGATYSRSKIVFNKSINGDVNMRVFEGMASGALLVTDRVANGLDRIGQAGVHFVTYTSAEDAVNKIRHYLAHAEEREAIAAEGQRHVFAHHTYTHRLTTILEVVASAVRLRAPARIAPGRVEAVWRSECMMHQGARPSAVGKLLLEGHLSSGLLRNAATAAARGVVRPLRQAIAARRSRK